MGGVVCHAASDAANHSGAHRSHRPHDRTLMVAAGAYMSLTMCWLKLNVYWRYGMSQAQLGYLAPVNTDK